MIVYVRMMEAPLNRETVQGSSPKCPTWKERETFPTPWEVLGVGVWGKNTIRPQPSTTNVAEMSAQKQEMAERCSGYLNFQTCKRTNFWLTTWLHRLMLLWWCMTGFREGGAIQTTLEKFKVAELRKAPSKWTLTALTVPVRSTVLHNSDAVSHCLTAQKSLSARSCLMESLSISQRPAVASEWHDLLHIGWFQQSSEWLATPIYSTIRIYEMGESTMAIHVRQQRPLVWSFHRSSTQDNEFVESKLPKKPRQTPSK